MQVYGNMETIYKSHERVDAKIETVLFKRFNAVV